MNWRKILHQCRGKCNADALHMYKYSYAICTHIHTYTYVCVCIHNYTYSYTHACMGHACMHAYMDVHAHTITYRCIYATFMYIHTYTVHRLLLCINPYSATLEQREFEAIQHIRESMQMVENAMLEKEQVTLLLMLKFKYTLTCNDVTFTQYSLKWYFKITHLLILYIVQ